MLEKIKKEFGYEDLKLIISTFIIGFLVHGMVFYNKFATDDSMYSFYDSLNTVPLGRFFSVVTGFFSSFYDLPVVNGFLTLLYGGISVVLLCKIFKVEDFIIKVLIGAVFISFPVVTANFGYMHLADAYMLGVLLSIASFYVFYCLGGNILIASLLLALSIGVYQLYLLFAALLCLLILIKEVLDGKKISKQFFNMLLYGAISLAIYFILMKLSLHVYQVELKDYQGVSTMFNVPLKDLPRNIIKGYLYFFHIIFNRKSYNFSMFSSLSYIIIIFIFLYVLYKSFVSNKKKESLILIFVFLAGIPFLSNLIYIFSDSNTLTYHLLMTHQYVIVLIFPLTLLKTLEKNIKKIAIISYLVLIFNYFIVANIAYYSMQQKYEKNYALALRVVNRIEQQGCNLHNAKLVFINPILGNPVKYISSNITDEVTSLFKGSDGNNLMITPFHFQQFVKHYIGVEFNVLDDKESEYYRSKINKNKEMQPWPHASSVKCLDDVVIIYFE